MSNKLQLTKSALEEAKDLPTMFELDAVRYNSVQNFMKTTGKNEDAALMHYEREKILFFKALQSNSKIANCDRFSVYSAWIELQVSGATLNEGHAFLIPYGKQLQFQMGWKGRLEQLIQIPTIVNIPPPQVVYDNDEFDYELGERPRIIKHKPAKKDRGELLAVYMIIQKQSGPETHLMLREEVINIRDRYSKPYNQYVADCKAAGKNIGDTFKKKIPGQNYEVTVEPPMWVTSPEEAWKKTLVKRVYKWQPKTARMKALDERIENNFDPETATGGEPTHDIDFGIVNDQPETNTGNSETNKPQPEIKSETPATSTRTRKKKEDAPAQSIPIVPIVETPSGDQVDTESGEVMSQEAETPTENPVDELPDLSTI